MAGNKAAIKSRIKSINATKKITGAMELIASVKLQKGRNNMLKNRTYAEAIKDTVSNMLSRDIEIDNEYLRQKDAPLKLYFIYGSDMGLCGGYNINLLKLAAETIKPNDYVFCIGTKIYPILKRNNVNILNEMVESDEVDYLYIKKLADEAIEMFKANKINSINVIYTEFINNVSFKPNVIKVLPCVLEKKEGDYKEVLFEPSPEKILNDLLPMMVENEVYAKLLESKTSEHGNRRFAMENATSNAEELTEELLLAYNQARQAAITSEITEIVAGADAL